MKKSIVLATITGLLLAMTPTTIFAQSPESERELKEKHEEYQEREEKERREDSIEQNRRLKSAEEKETSREDLERRIKRIEEKLSVLREWLLHFQNAATDSEGRKKHLYELRVKILNHLIAKFEEKLTEAKIHLENTKTDNPS